MKGGIIFVIVFFSLAAVGGIVIAIFLSKKSKTVNYSCNFSTGKCEENKNGKYKSLKDCEDNCKPSKGSGSSSGPGKTSKCSSNSDCDPKCEKCLSGMCKSNCKDDCHICVSGICKSTCDGTCVNGICV